MLPPGTLLINRYRILNLEAQGGQGAVYRAEDLRLGERLVAIKEMLIPTGASTTINLAAASRAFQLETSLLARLNHPNLPKIYDSFEQGGNYYVAMEFIAGRTLAFQLREHPRGVPEHRVMEWARQLCDVLAYLHRQQPPIVFRDLKPANVMLDSHGNVKLIDFGIARHFKPGKTADTQAMGTPGFAAPEQYGTGQTDARSDIYSLGITLHRLLTGHDPGETPFQPPPVRDLNPDVSEQTAAAIERALNMNADQRWQTMQEFRHALPIPTDEFPPPAGQAARRSGLWLLAAGGLGVLALLLCVAAVGGYTFLSGGRGLSDLIGDGAATQPAATTTPAEPTSPPDLPTGTPVPDVATDTAVPDKPTAAPTPASVELTLGDSVEGRAIEARRFGDGSRVIVFIGGLHAGFAPGTVALADQASEHFDSHPSAVPADASLYIIRSANPDSPYSPGEYAGRLNASGVDLNRNWDCEWAADAVWRSSPISGGSAPFSEPETRVLRDFLLAVNPQAVIFWEAKYTGGLAAPGGCGDTSLASEPLASTYGGAAGYAVGKFEAYTVTGDGTNWLDSLRIPAISVLLPDYTAADWSSNLRGILAVLEAYGK